MAEWLRRWTRNPLGSARVGSNPTGVVWYRCWCCFRGQGISWNMVATPDSSVGRACDCRSHGPWFDSGSGDFLLSFFLISAKCIARLVPPQHNFPSSQGAVSIVVSIPAFHAGGPGSIPGRRTIFINVTRLKNSSEKSQRQNTHRGARTHDHQVKSLTLYRLS